MVCFDALKSALIDNVAQNDTQGDTQGDIQGNDLDIWLEAAIRKNPKITTEELARKYNKSIITIKLTMPGCAYFSQEKVAGTVSTVFEIAYVAGGATRVEQHIDQMVTDGKITEEQAVQLKIAAQKSYEELQKKLKELAVAEVQVEVPKTE